MIFVVLPKPKIDGAMYDSTCRVVKTREEQQQMCAQLLFYHSTKSMCAYGDYLMSEKDVPASSRFLAEAAGARVLLTRCFHLFGWQTIIKKIA